MTTHLHGSLRVARHRGLSIVELMVAMALGLVVSGVVLSNYLGSRQAQRTSAALAEVTENANLGFNLMRRYISLAGYSEVTGVSETGLTRAYTGKAVFGCSTSFASNVVRGIDQLSCSTQAGSRPDAISVTYQATSSNALMGTRQNSGTPEPRDALGQYLYKGSPTTPDYLAEARFMISATGQFMMAGNGGGSASSSAAPTGHISTAETLFDNVVDMRIWYGLSGTGSDGKPNQQVSTYTQAQDIGGVEQSGWHQVTSVRVCLLLASAQEVLDSKMDYFDCDAQTAETPSPVTAPDRRYYRAFTTTIHIPNRLGG